MPRPATRALIDAMLMIRPPRPRSIIAPPSHFVHSMQLVRFRSISSPAFERHRFRGDVLAPAAHVVDQDVDRAVTIQGRPARLFAFGRLADIRREGPGLPAQGADVAGRPLQTGWVAADEDDVRAGIGDRERHLPPQPATAAGDEETLSRQSEPV